MNKYGLPIRIIEQFEAPHPKANPAEQEISAIHSGKLGDIVYALPACQQLEVNHLLLNLFSPKFDPKRIFTLKSARQIVPLLLKQKFIRKVSIVQTQIQLEQAGPNIPGIKYNFDTYRNVARHKLPDLDWIHNKQVVHFSKDQVPIHLVQMFAASQGIRVQPTNRWIEAPTASDYQDKIVVSLTPRWRSFPSWYWRILLSGLRNLEFIGVPNDSSDSVKTIETPDHLRLASIIAGCKLFLGTVSFPYALAEGLKANRLIEVCHFNLNAYPIFDDNRVLSLDVIAARNQIADLLNYPETHPYRVLTRKFVMSPTTAIRRFHLIAHKKSAAWRLKKGAQFRLKWAQYRFRRALRAPLAS